MKRSSKMDGHVHIFDHPLIRHKVTILRNRDTSSREFRSTVQELALLMAYEVTNDLPTEGVEIQTPMAPCQGEAVDEAKIAIIPILRAGLGMIEGFQMLLPNARVGHIGLSRNEETLEPEAYYHKLPADIDQSICIVVDPMLATGGSAIDAVSFLKKEGAKNIKFVGLLGANEGIQKLSETHPDVPIYLAARDASLNEAGYIVPGLGDAGDRIFGTDF